MIFHLITSDQLLNHLELYLLSEVGLYYPLVFQHGYARTYLVSGYKILPPVKACLHMQIILPDSFGTIMCMGNVVSLRFWASDRTQS